MAQLYKKILIATDGSENNRAATEEALRIARASGAMIHAVYVMDTGVLNTAAMVDGEEFVFRSLKIEGDRALNKVKEMADDVRVEVHVLQGKPAFAITDFAAKNSIDLIVVGAMGKSGLEALLIGSVADRVVRTSTCPVLVVKTKDSTKSAI
jgi:nucleotide-binding universal stress UspA family protein